ncbi:MAG: polysulfide reductase NrfD [Gammaproteobacteria bacterium]|nr:polysulfide reductase NrfD [Gammaproteobacteria bacterium]
MVTQRYQPITTSSAYKLSMVIALVGLCISGLGAFNMEHEGHHITGMSNQVIWGMPHVIAIFLIVSASGALNVASIASVFNKDFYKPLARLSAVVAVALLVGGLAVILLDLGRPDRLLIAMTHYNFSSIFAWNIILYTGFVGLTLVYLWTMLDWQVEQYKRIAGIAAFCWRLILTAGTGSIFGVLIAREAYNIAIMGPMFIVLSLAYGLAFYLIVLDLFMDKEEFTKVEQRLSRLLVVLVLCGLAVSVIYHLANWFLFDAQSFEFFLLASDEVYPWLLWGVHLTLGCILPILLLHKHKTILASLLVIIGGVAQFYALVIGGQSYPMPLLEGYAATSTFSDGIIASYSPSHWELMLGSGGFAVALLITVFTMRLFRLLPSSR